MKSLLFLYFLSPEAIESEYTDFLRLDDVQLLRPPRVIYLSSQT